MCLCGVVDVSLFCAFCVLMSRSVCVVCFCMFVCIVYIISAFGLSVRGYLLCVCLFVYFSLFCFLCVLCVCIYFRVFWYVLVCVVCFVVPCLFASGVLFVLCIYMCVLCV